MDITGPPPVPPKLHSEKGAELVLWLCLSPNKKAGLELWALTRSSPGMVQEVS